MKLKVADSNPKAEFNETDMCLSQELEEMSEILVDITDLNSELNRCVQMYSELRHCRRTVNTYGVTEGLNNFINADFHDTETALESIAESAGKVKDKIIDLFTWIKDKIAELLKRIGNWFANQARRATELVQRITSSVEKDEYEAWGIVQDKMKKAINNGSVSQARKIVLKSIEEDKSRKQPFFPKLVAMAESGFRKQDLSFYDEVGEQTFPDINNADRETWTQMVTALSTGQFTKEVLEYLEKLLSHLRDQGEDDFQAVDVQERRKKKYAKILHKMELQTPRFMITEAVPGVGKIWTELTPGSNGQQDEGGMKDLIMHTKDAVDNDMDTFERQGFKKKISVDQIQKVDEERFSLHGYYIEKNYAVTTPAQLGVESHSDVQELVKGYEVIPYGPFLEFTSDVKEGLSNLIQEFKDKDESEMGEEDQETFEKAGNLFKNISEYITSSSRFLSGLSHFIDNEIGKIPQKLDEVNV